MALEGELATPQTMAESGANPFEGASSFLSDDPIEGGTDGENPIEGAKQESQPSNNKVTEEKAADKPAEVKPAPTKETLTFDGKSVEIDWNDREALKKHVAMSVGARKWQAERDRVKKQLDTILPKYEESKQHLERWTKMIQANKTMGLRGVLEFIYENPDEVFEAEIQKRMRLMELDPESRKLAQEREKFLIEKAKVDMDKAEFERQTKDFEEQKGAAEKAEMEATVNPIYFKHCFDGKFGDPDFESDQNMILWQKATKRLDALQEAGNKITATLTEKIFREEAERISRFINSKAEAKANEVVQNKKVEAKTQLSTAVATTPTAAVNKDEEVDRAFKEDGFLAGFRTFMNS